MPLYRLEACSATPRRSQADFPTPFGGIGLAGAEAAGPEAGPQGNEVVSIPRSAWLALAGGLLFLVIFQWGYAGINPLFYEFRDDGIITLSHARNLIDFGFIGVNPSGERLEATSAPLQMLLYALGYGLTGVGFQNFMTAQTLAATFGLGSLFALFFADRPLFAMGACAASALALTRLPTFMVWHGSGMENALTHVLLLWTLLLLYRFTGTGRVRLRLAVVPFLASITRIDAIFHVMPLLLLFCFYWQGKYRDRQARDFTATVAVLWLLFNLCRYAYFGSLSPNTAVAQGISVGERALELAALSPLYLDQSFSLARSIFSHHGGYLLLLVLPLAMFRPTYERAALLLALAACLIGTALFAPFIFGPARLDTARTTTHMALFVLLALCATASGWTPRRLDMYLLPFAGALVFLVHAYLGYQPGMSCCSHSAFEPTRLAFERIGRENDLYRPTVANPDLGLLSWSKQFNIVDLGLLGSSLMPRLEEGPALNNYFLEYAAPDMIESHGGLWTCRYAGVFLDPRFAAMYSQADGPGRKTATCKGGAEVPHGIWVRRDIMRDSSSRERVLSSDLARQLSVERVAMELDICQRTPGSVPTNCTYVARSVYRMLPEFRARGDLPRLREIFHASRSADYDLFLVTGADDAHAFRKALTYLTSSRPWQP